MLGSHPPLPDGPQRESPLLERFRCRFLVFHGRIGRLEYLLASLAVPIAITIAAVIASAIVGSVLRALIGDLAGVVFGLPLLVAWIVLIGWISLAAGVRRWHDLGFSGWMLLLSLVPLLGALLGIVLLVWPGEKGDNKYGPQP